LPRILVVRKTVHTFLTKPIRVASLWNFLHNTSDKDRTLKRGGGVQLVSRDAWLAEAPSQFSFSFHSLPFIAMNKKYPNSMIYVTHVYHLHS